MFYSLVLILWYSTAYASVVDIPDVGLVEGTVEKSRNGNEFHAFRGIPYAKPPINKLRFQDPEMPESWNVIRKATKFREGCPYLKYRINEVAGEEDCLYLNVFSSMLDPVNKNPVIVWIQGGGFSFGDSSMFGPDYFMDKPLVLVTFNFRQSALGFMYFDDEHLSGNYGMKDQVAVLKWVKRNIHVFGGNPEVVTLAGQNSGAMSVNWHMYSPQSQGLFHRVIIQSGTARSLLAHVPKHVAKKRTTSIATLAGCMFESSREIMICLQKKTFVEILKWQQILEIWMQKGVFYFGVVIESSESKNPFVSISPWTTHPLSRNIPMIIGYTSDEGGRDVSDLLLNRVEGAAIQQLAERYDELLPIIMTYQFNAGLKTNDDVLDAAEKIKKFYFQNEIISEETSDNLLRMLSDYKVIYSTIETLLMYEANKYFYVYSHRNVESFITTVPYKPEYYTKKFGAVHGDDLISIFKLKPFKHQLADADLDVSKLMIDLWTSFAYDGNPNFCGLAQPCEATTIPWLPYNTDYKGPTWNVADTDLKFYSIENDPKVKKWEGKEMQRFWKSLKWPLS